MNILVTAGILLMAGVLLFWAESRRELKNFRVTDYSITSEKLAGLQREYRVVFLSDLHNKIYGRENEPLLNAIRRSEPDLILIGGDMLIGKAGCPYDAALQFVRQLPKIAPVYYGNGNHEQRMKERPEIYGDVYEKYKKELVRAGVTFLENASADLDFDGISIRLSGFEPPMTCYKKFAKAEDVTADMLHEFGRPDGERYRILLGHNPALVDSYRSWGADLTLSGHLHGGIIRLPFLGGLITPQAKLFPRHSGEYSEENGRVLIVSKGLGTHTVNIRFCNPAEVVVVHFHGAISE